MDRQPKFLKVGCAAINCVSHVYTIVASSAWAVRTAADASAYTTDVAISAMRASGATVAAATSASANTCLMFDAALEIQLAHHHTCDKASSALKEASEMAFVASAAHEHAMSTYRTALDAAKVSLAHQAALVARAAFAERAAFVAMCVYIGVVGFVLGVALELYARPLYVAWRARRAANRIVADAVPRIVAHNEAAWARAAAAQADMDAAQADMDAALAAVGMAQDANDAAELAAATQAGIAAVRADMEAAHADVHAAMADTEAVLAAHYAAHARIDATLREEEARLFPADDVQAAGEAVVAPENHAQREAAA